MKKWLPVVLVILGFLLLYPVAPRYTTGILAMVVLLLLVNKWGVLQTYFK